MSVVHMPSPVLLRPTYLPPFPLLSSLPACPIFFNSIQTSAVRLRACHRQLGCAIKFLASHGILHRDIKACNALMCVGEGVDGFTVRLLDFGLSQTDAFSKPMEVQGTPGYIAPEVREGRLKADMMYVFFMYLFFLLHIFFCVYKYSCTICVYKGGHRALCPPGSSV